MAGLSQANEVRAPQTRGFLFADLRGYTAYVERHGDVAASELLAAYRAVVRDVVSRTDGAEIRTEGDSFYIVFPSASSAVLGGLAILDSASRPWREGSGPIPVGVGVHAGETADTAEGFVGSAVNIAARVCSVAQPGELLVTDTVRGLTRTLVHASFTSRGAPRLKGITEPIPLYRVTPGGADGAARQRTSRRWQSRGALMIAIAAVATVAVVVVGALALGFGRGPNVPAPSPTSPAIATTLVVASSTPTGSTAPPTVAPLPSVAVSAVASGGPDFPTRAEAALLARLPIGIRSSCRRALTSDGAAGGQVSLVCDLPLGADADTAWFDQYGGLGETVAQYSGIVARGKPPAGTCSDKVASAAGAWNFGITLHGQLACFPRDGAAFVVWTYDTDPILGRASRADGNASALYQWWKQVAPFLGPP